MTIQGLESDRGEGNCFEKNTFLLVVKILIKLFLMAIEGTVHRAGALKQTNKSHKHGKHRSNRQLDTENKGNRKLGKLNEKFNQNKYFRPSFSESFNKKR